MYQKVHSLQGPTCMWAKRNESCMDRHCNTMVTVTLKSPNYKEGGLVLMQQSQKIFTFKAMMFTTVLIFINYQSCPVFQKVYTSSWIWVLTWPQYIQMHFNLPNRLWGLLGPQRTKIVHIFVIGWLPDIGSHISYGFVIWRTNQHLGSEKTPQPVKCCFFYHPLGRLKGSRKCLT